MAAAAKVYDKFCWSCENPVAKSCGFECAKCIRTFDQCRPDLWNHCDLDNWLCPVCLKIETSALTSKPQDLEKLSIIVDRAIDMKLFGCLKNPYVSASDESGQPSVSDLVNPINLTMVKTKMASYTCNEEFLADIQWIVHNYTILLGKKHEITKAAKALYDFCNIEINILSKCSECYSNASRHPSDWFVRVCNVPHLIVWAKMSSSNYWPAKVMSTDGNVVNVRFFGDHTHARGPATNCLLYTQRNPNRKALKTPQYKDALEEADLYLANILEKFGSVNLADGETMLDPTQLDHYISTMVPGLKKVQKRSQASSAAPSDSSMFKSPNESARKKARITVIVEDNPIELPQLNINEFDFNGTEPSSISTISPKSAGLNQIPISLALTPKLMSSTPDLKSMSSAPDPRPVSLTSDPKPASKNCEVSAVADPSGLCQNYEQIKDKLGNMITVMSDFQNTFTSPIDAMKNEISRINASYTQEIAALKTKHQGIITKANQDAEAARDRIAILENSIAEFQSKISEFQSKSQDERQRTLKAEKRAKALSDAIADLSEKVRAANAEDESDEI